MSSIQSDPTSASTPSPNPTSPGASLKAAREARGLSVAEVSAALKLSPRQVEALERDDFAALPDMPIVRGFTRNYARLLALDAAPLLASLRALAGQDAPSLAPICNADGDIPSATSRRLRSFPLGKVMAVIALLIAGSAYFDWFQTMPEQSVAELNPPAFAPAPTQAVAQEPALAGPQGDLSAPLQPGAPAAQLVPGAQDAGLSGATAAAPAGAPAAPLAEPVAPAVQPQLVFRFTAESWIEVRDAAGSIIFAGSNPAGSARTVQGTPPFAVVVGNPAGVSLEFNGQPVKLAARKRGEVVRLSLP